MAEALALEEALAVSSREAALLEQREALDVQLAIDASMMDITQRDEMLPQLQWLRQPASLLRLLERPVWLDAWLRGEEERASLLWRRLPNDLLLHLLKLRVRPTSVTCPCARSARGSSRSCRCIWRVCLVCSTCVPSVESSKTHAYEKRDHLPVSHARRAGPPGTHCVSQMVELR